MQVTVITPLGEALGVPLPPPPLKVLLGLYIDQNIKLHQYTTSMHMKRNATFWVTRYNLVLVAGHHVIAWYSRQVTTL